MDGVASLGSARAEIRLDSTQAIAALKQFGSAADQTMQGVGTAGAQAATGLDRISKSLSTPEIQAAGGVFAGIGVAVLGGFAVATRGAVQFDQAMANVNSVAGLSQGELANLNDQVLALASNPGITDTPTQLAEGLYDIVSSGFDAADALTVLEVAANAATAGMTDTSVSGRAISSVLNAYGLDATHAADVSDYLFQTVNSGVITFEELANNMSSVLPVASQMGVGIDEVGAAYASLTLQSYSATQAETGVANILRAAVNPTEALTAAVQEQGYSSAQAAVEALGFGGFLDLLTTASGGTAEGMFDLLGTAEGTSAAMALGNEAGSGYNDMLGDMQTATDGAGATQAALAEQMAGAGFKIDKAKQSLGVMATMIGGIFLPAVGAAAEFVTRLATAFTNLPSGVQTVIVGITGVVGALAGIAGAAILIGPKLIQMAQGFKAISVAMRALTLSNPILLAIAAAIALIVLAVAAYKTNFLGFADLVNSAGSKIKDVFTGIKDAVVGFVDGFKDKIDQLMGPMKGAIEITDVFGNKISVIGNVGPGLGRLAATFQALADTIRGIGGGDIGIFNGIADGIEWVGSAVQGVIGFFQTWQSAWERLTAPIKEARTATDAFGNTVTVMVNTGERMNGLVAIFYSLSEAIRSIGGGKIGWLNAIAAGFEEVGAIVGHFLKQIQPAIAILKAGFGEGFVAGLASIDVAFKLIAAAVGDALDSLGDLGQRAFARLGKAVGTLADRFPALRNTFTALAKVITNGGEIMADVFHVVADVLRGDFSGALDGLKSLAGNVLDGIGNGFELLVSIVTDVAGMLQSLLGSAFDALSSRFDAFSSTFDRLGGIVTNIIGVVRNLGEALLAAFSGDWGAVWENLQDAFTDAVQAILNAAVLIPTFLLELFTGMSWSEIGTVIKDAFTDAFDVVRDAAQSAWDDISSGASALKDRLGQAISDALNGAIGMIASVSSDIWSWIKDSVGNVDWAGIGSDLLAGVKEATGYVVGLGSDLLDAGAELVSGLLQGAQNTYTSVKNWFVSIPGDIVNAIGSFTETLTGKGTELLSGLEQGARTGYTAAKTWLASIAGDITSAVGSFAETLKGKGTELLGGLEAGARAGYTIAKTWLASIPGDIVTAIGGFATTLVGKGQELLNGLLTGAKTGYTAAKQWLSTVPADAGLAIVGAVTALVSRGAELLTGLLDGMKTGWTSAKTWLASVVPDAAAAMVGAVSALVGRGGDLLTGLLDGAKTGWTAAKAWIATVPVDAAAAIVNAVTALVGRGTDLLTGLLNGAKQGWTAAKSWLATVPADAARAIAGAVTALVGRGGELLTGLWNGAKAGWTTVKTWAASIPGDAAAAIVTAVTALVSRGTDLITGLWNGLKDTWTLAKAWLSTVPTSAAGAIVGAVTALKQVGIDFIQGLWDGATEQWTKFTNWLSDLNPASFLSGKFSNIFGGDDKPPAVLNPHGGGGTDKFAGQQMPDFGSLGPSGGGKSGAMGGLSGATAGLAGILSEITAFVTSVQAATTSVRTAISTMKTGVIADITATVTTTIALFTGWAASIGVAAAGIGLAVRLPISTMKIGVVTDITDMVNTTIALFGAWAAAIPAITAAVGLGVRLPISTMKIGVVADVTDLANSTIALFGAWAAALPAIATGVSAGVRAAVSTMKIGAVADVRDLVSSSIAQFGAMSAGLTAIASSVSASVRSAISTMKIGAVADVRDLVNTAIAQFGAMSSGLTSIASTIRSSVVSSMSAMASGAGGAAQGMAGSVIGAMQSMSAGAIGAAANMVGTVIGIIAGGAGAGSSAGFGLGSAIGQGVASGMNSALGAVQAAANAIVATATRAMAAAAQIRSPSRLFARVIGGPITQGVAVGMLKLLGTVREAGVAVTDAAAAAMTAPTAGFGFGSGFGGAGVSPLALSPLPARASMGSGLGGQVFNFTLNATVNGNGTVSYDAGQLSNAFESELPALTNAIRRNLGGS